MKAIMFLLTLTFGSFFLFFIGSLTVIVLHAKQEVDDD